MAKRRVRKPAPSVVKPRSTKEDRRRRVEQTGAGVHPSERNKQVARARRVKPRADDEGTWSV